MNPRVKAAADAERDMPDILRALGDEHSYQARLLKLLEKHVALLNQRQQPDYAVMAGVMGYMTRYPDRFHHPKEDLLFERIVRRDPEARGKVDALLAAHGEIIAKGSALLAAIESCRDGGPDADADRLRKAAHAYIGILRRHMDIEHLQMFPLAQRVLLAEDWAEIDARMKPVLDPVFGAGAADEFSTIRQAEAAKPDAQPLGRLGTTLVEAAALIETVTTLIAGTTKLRRTLARHQRDVMRFNAESMVALMGVLPLGERLRLVGEVCRRNLQMAGENQARMLEQWSSMWTAAWRPYEDDGPYAPKLLRCPCLPSTRDEKVQS